MDLHMSVFICAGLSALDDIILYYNNYIEFNLDIISVTLLFCVSILIISP